MLKNEKDNINLGISWFKLANVYLRQLLVASIWMN